jgi:hypothetical protein
MSDRVHKLCTECISDILSDILSIGHRVNDLCPIDIGSHRIVSSETFGKTVSLETITNFLAQLPQSNAEKVAQEINADFRALSAMYAVLTE